MLRLNAIRSSWRQFVAEQATTNKPCRVAVSLSMPTLGGATRTVRVPVDQDAVNRGFDGFYLFSLCMGTALLYGAWAVELLRVRPAAVATLDGTLAARADLTADLMSPECVAGPFRRQEG